MRHLRIILPLCYLVAALTACLSVQAADTGPTPAERVGMPAVDSALKIDHPYTPNVYPKLIYSVGGAFTFLDNSDLEASVNRLLGAYGVTTAPSSFGGPKANFYSAVRLQFNDRIGIWIDGVLAGEPGNRSTSLSAFSIGGLVTALHSPRGTVALSFGAGITVQELQALHRYSELLSDGGTLEEIAIQSGRVTGYPVVALLDLCDPAKTRFGLFVSARYVFSPDATITQQVYRSGEQILESINMSMSGLRLAGGLTFGW